MANVLVPFPGASVRSVENLVGFPLEQKLSEIQGVKHVYSMSRAGHGGRDRGVSGRRAAAGSAGATCTTRSIPTPDWAPAGLGVGQPLVKPYGIDDVPMMAVTLWSDRADIDAEQLAQGGAHAGDRLKRIAGTRDVYTIGAPDRAVMVEIDPARLATYHLTRGRSGAALKAANVAADVGSEVAGNQATCRSRPAPC